MPALPSKSQTIQPFWQTSDKQTVKLYNGDVIDVLKKLPRKSVQCVITSPPYYALRDYKTAKWEGGDPNCDHSDARNKTRFHRAGMTEKQASNKGSDGSETTWKEVCPTCGAKQVDFQIGSEPECDCLGWARGELCDRCFVCKIVKVFAEVWEVLRDDGTVFLNLGDTYANTTSGGNGATGGLDKSTLASKMPPVGTTPTRRHRTSIPTGNAFLAPHRVAIALQHFGWIVRQDIVWYKPSPMPESCLNRCTKAHEYIFLLSKRKDYFYDNEAVKEEAAYGYCETVIRSGKFISPGTPGDTRGSRTTTPGKGGSRNKRSVWDIANPAETLLWLQEYHPEVFDEYCDKNKLDVWKITAEAFPGSHYATFPQALVKPCILAGTSKHGACEKCGAPWKRVTEKTQLKRERPNDYVKRTGEDGTGNSCANSVAGVEVKTLGWEPTCTCFGTFIKEKVPATGNTAGLEDGGVPTGWATGIGNSHKAKDAQPSNKTRITKADRREAAAESREAAKDKFVNVTKYVPSIPLEEHPVKPCTVMDIFIGSGTTCCVAIANGRHSIGIDLSEDYLKQNAICRIEGELMKRHSTSHLTGRVPKKILGSGDSLL